MAEAQRRYTLVPGLLEVSSNVQRVAGFLTPLYSIPNGEPGKINIALEVKDGIGGPSRKATSFGSIWGEPDADDVRYAVRLLGPLRAHLRLRRLRGSPEIRVNWVYHRAVRLRLGNVQPVGRHLADVVAVKLLQHQCALVHAAAVAFNGQGVLLVAPGQTGKSLASLRAVESGFTFLAEDVAITDGERVYGLPLSVSFACDIRGEEMGLRDRFSRLRVRSFQWAAAALPPLTYLLPFPSLNILSLAPQTRIESQAPLAFVFILGRGPREVVPLSPQEALAKLILVNRSEFSYYQNNLLLGYSYFNPWLNLSDLMREEEKLLAKAVENAACFWCQGPEPGAIVEQIESIVAK